MGNKTERQNQYVRKLTAKIKKFKANGKSTERLEKELGYMKGEDRPAFKSGREADPRYKKRHVPD